MRSTTSSVKPKPVWNHGDVHVPSGAVENVTPPLGSENEW
jgi:hypothetical protein